MHFTDPSLAGSFDDTSYGYDSNDRLIEALTKNAGGATVCDYVYGYDASANLTSRTVSGSGSCGSSSPTYSYNAANELTTTGYSFDADGNETAAPATANPASITLHYNALNQTDTFTPSGSSTITETYLGPGQTERSNAGSVGLINDLLGIAARTSGATTTYYTRTPDGTVLGTHGATSSSYQYFLLDGLNSITAITDSTGTLLNQTDNYRYDPYGQPLNTPTGYPTTNPWRYANSYYDTTTGLYKNGARYYDPSTSRWTQQDQLQNPLDTHGWNQYDYADDDPINNIDPSGECIICSDPLGIGSAAHVIGAATVRAAGAVILGGAVAAAAGTVVLGAACFVAGGELEPFHCLGAIAGGAIATAALACTGIHTVRTGRPGFCVRVPR